ncbi:uncharacterized protein SETTUDRAFT_98254 [Exserohilum turcica Et28A]|uniref:N-acetyltransferase domain-containing protein n=1 Tax=Exserohilum turcicum (strain 28A) TaxID=671987 RepID=R0JW91_EXST2|nr:uncharacterized protein SETTUDRAFT_98254 [Exserohilum turcica Et28A]EOA81759.1 hypothetical protein SETTUDRAFT_98254 [Exserohilum turcica Et28A]
MEPTPQRPKQRLEDGDIRIEICTVNDADTIAQGLHACYGEESWARKEPQELRPAEPIRRQRLVQRLMPVLAHGQFTFLKAVLASTGETVGAACWGHPDTKTTHDAFRRSALAHYGWQSSLGLSDTVVDQMWSGVSSDWESGLEQDDEERARVMQGEAHWYLALLITWPAFQGRGVASRLIRWGLQRADRGDKATPVYLKTSMKGREVYRHYGFAGVGESSMVRRPQGGALMG